MQPGDCPFDDPALCGPESGSGHGGTIVDPGWAATAIELQSFTGAVPRGLSPDGGSFSVMWAAANS